METCKTFPRNLFTVVVKIFLSGQLRMSSLQPHLSTLEHGVHFIVLVYSMQLALILKCDPISPSVMCCLVVFFQGGRKSGLFSPSTASLPAFSSLAPNAEESNVTLRPSCTLGPDSAITADSPSSTGTTLHQSS